MVCVVAASGQGCEHIMFFGFVSWPETEQYK